MLTQNLEKRKSKKETALAGSNLCDIPEEEIPFEEPGEHLLYQEVMELPEKYRIVMHLYYYEDLTIREIAEILGKSESGIKMRLSRGREFLKNILKEEMEG